MDCWNFICAHGNSHTTNSHIKHGLNKCISKRISNTWSNWPANLWADASGKVNTSSCPWVRSKLTSSTYFWMCCIKLDEAVDTSQLCSMSTLCSFTETTSVISHRFKHSVLWYCWLGDSHGENRTLRTQEASHTRHFGSKKIVVHVYWSVRTLTTHNSAYNCNHGSKCPNDQSVLQYWDRGVLCMYFGTKCPRSKMCSNHNGIPSIKSPVLEIPLVIIIIIVTLVSSFALVRKRKTVI